MQFRQKTNDRIIAGKIASFAEEKRSLQIKHEKTCAVNKSLKNDNENLKKDLNQSSVALKSAKKEIKDQTHKHEKKILESWATPNWSKRSLGQEESRSQVPDLNPQSQIVQIPKHVKFG